jgi:hypothetical protein
MRRLAVWLTASRTGALSGAIVAALLGRLPFLSWLPGATIAFLALSPSSPIPDWSALVLADVVFAEWLWVHGAGLVGAVLVSLALLLPALLLARLLRRTQSLTLCFQMAALAALGFLVVVHLVLADPPGVWRPVIEAFAAELDRMGAVVSNVGSGRMPQDINVIVYFLWGVVAWMLLLHAMVGVIFGLYLRGRLEGKALLGPAFRQLKAGRTLAVLAVVSTVMLVAVPWTQAADGTLLLAGVFVLQGLAVVHSARVAYAANTGWLVAMYGLLFLPPTTLLVMGGLSILGFLDNWLSFRAYLPARTDENRS